MKKTSWQWQMQNAFRDEDKLAAFLNNKVAKTLYPLMIPPRLAEKIRAAGPTSPLWRQFVPCEGENNPAGLKDPIGDHINAIEGQIIHRYHNRVLFLPTTICPINCRYCFRKNELASPDNLFKANFAKTISYLKNNPYIEEIIYSGGDPLMLSNEKLSSTLESFAALKTIKFIRLHSRVPSILPARLLDPELQKILIGAGKKFATVSLVIHTNHPDELDKEVEEAIKKLPSLNLLSQSVLLAKVNDSAETLRKLCLRLNAIGIRPYYLHHPDPVMGGAHFELSTKKGLEIYNRLRNILPGWLLPSYVIERPQGMGKTDVDKRQITPALPLDS